MVDTATGAGRRKLCKALGAFPSRVSIFGHQKIKVPDLPIGIEQIFWNLAKMDVHKRLKTRSWREVHDELVSKVPMSHAQAQFMAVWLEHVRAQPREPVHVVFGTAGRAGIGHGSCLGP